MMCVRTALTRFLAAGLFLTALAAGAQASETAAPEPVTGEASTNVPAIDSADLRVLLQEDANLVLVDVRPQAEFLSGHLPFAVSFPWSGDKADDSKKRLARLMAAGARPVVVYGGEPLELSEIAAWIATRNPGPVSVYLAGTSGWAQYEGGFLEIEWEGLWSLLTQESPVVLDVRAEKRYAAGHIPGAIRVEPRRSWGEAYFKQPSVLAWKKPGLPIVTYCTSAACGASRKLAAEFSKAGFGPVYQFPGGYDEWEERVSCLTK